jgi:hypothetical protein
MVQKLEWQEAVGLVEYVNLHSIDNHFAAED